MHPPIGWLAEPPDQSHPIGAGLGVVEAFDERYSNLHISLALETVLFHSLDRVEQPLSLARQDADGRRTVYGLGHGPESYASASRDALLHREGELAAGHSVTLAGRTRAARLLSRQSCSQLDDGAVSVAAALMSRAATSSTADSTIALA